LLTLHLWAWALHVEGSERRGWLLEAIARRIAADGELRERLCAQIT
jgi:hypothetical protein